MTQQNTNLNHPIDDDKIDLIALVKTLWEGRKTIIKIIIIFMSIGLFVALFSEKEYSASTTMVLQSSEGSSKAGSLGGLAALVGVNLGSMGDNSVIPPVLYPLIVNSIPFQKELLRTPLTIEGQSEKVTFEDYYTNIYSPGLLAYIKKYSIGLPNLIIKAIKGKPDVVVDNSSNLLRLTKEEIKLIKKLGDQLLLNVNDKDEYISLTVNMPEPLCAAEMTKNAQELLQQYIIKFKVQKSSEQFKFIQERYIEKEKKFKIIQQQLAHFQDRNQFVNSALAKTTLIRLQSEYDLAYGVYAELAKQLETQQIQLKKDTPIFTILKPVSIPVEKAKPKRFLILLFSTFIGFILGIAYIFTKEFITQVKLKWNDYSV